VPVRLAFVSGILFLSGSSALLFQTLWLRLSGLAFGNSIWAAALVLSSFMAGLALGSAMAAAWTLRGLRPLRVYAGLEVLIAVLGSTLVFGLPHLGELMRPVFQVLWTHQCALNVLRFTISFLILVVPTTAMGLTLPVLLEDPALTRQEFARGIGILYGFNTLGAVAGALLGETVLVRMFGLFGTGLTASLVSCASAAMAWLFAGREAVPLGQPPTRFRIDLSSGSRPPWTLLNVSLAAGAIFLTLEVVWLRFLRLYVASTSIAFCVMLAVVLGGIGLGGIASGMIQRRLLSPRKLLPIVLVSLAIATLTSYIFFPVPAAHRDTNAFHIESWQQIERLSLALMFPVAFLSGILLPAIVTCVQRQVENRMNSTGLTILFNTAGAALGPLLTGFILLPSVGFQSSLILAAIGYVALAILTSDKTSWSFQQPSGVALLALSTLFILTVAFFPYRRDEMHFANARRPFEADGSRLLRKTEGNADTLQLLRRDLFGQPYYYRLITNAYSMSGTLPRSQRYMRLFTYLPLVLRPQSETALLICYGVGVTADAFTRDAHLKHLDVVDISKEVFALAGSYSGIEYLNPLGDPRVRTFVQDGRFFLQASPEQYDIITGEPPPVKVVGSVNLYTQQFFSLMSSRLKPGGIVTFWLPIYQLTPDETKAVLRAFHNVFPNASVWATCDLEWIMAGIKDPVHKLDAESSGALWRDPQTGMDLRRIGVELPEQMSALFVMDGKEIDVITQGIKPLTDFYPKRLTDVHPDLNEVYRFGYSYLQRSAALHHFLSSALIEQMWPDEWKRSLELYFLVRETRFISEMSGSNWFAELDLYLRHTRLRAPVLGVEDSDEFRLALAQKLASNSFSAPPEVLRDLVAGALADRDYPRAIQLLERQRNDGTSKVDDLLLLTYLYCLNGNVEKAEALAAAEAPSIEKGSFGDSLWRELQAEFGFRPPRTHLSN
jgi:spermidine synthase